LPSERRAGRFQDILHNIVRIERFTAGTRFRNILPKRAGVLRGPARASGHQRSCSEIARDAEALAAEQPWQAIRGLGNVLRHASDGVDPNAIWRIVRDDLRSLKQSVERALGDFKGDGEP
jgi:uncharacterized protein with HEPN domain